MCSIITRKHPTNILYQRETIFRINIVSDMNRDGSWNEWKSSSVK